VKMNTKLLMILTITTVLILLFIPIPVQAQILEGITELPEGIGEVLRYAPFNGTFRLENTTFFMDNLKIECDLINAGLRTTTFSNNSIKSVEMDLAISNCKITSHSFNGTFQNLIIHFDAKANDDNTVSYKVQATEYTSLYKLITSGR